MNFSRPLFWHQGLFLQPQHFQLSDLYQQACSNAVRQAASPFMWGIKHLNIEKAALGNRTLSIDSGEIIFPDGTWVTIPDNALVQSRSLEQEWTGDGSPLKVYLGIKKLDTGNPNVTVLENLDDLSQVSTRFVSRPEPEAVDDLHGEGPPGQVKMLYHVVRPFFSHEKEQLGDYVFLPVAEIILEGDDLDLSPAFVPPVLSLKTDTVLLRLVKEIRDLLASKGYQLAEYKTQRGIHSAEFGSRDMVYLLALRSLNRYVPALFHVVETGNVHPWHVYGLLRQLIGELSSFSEGYDVLGKGPGMEAGMPPYDHRDMYRCFSAALETVAALIEEITAGPEYVISLDFDGTYYSAELRPGIFRTGNRYYLALTTAEDPEKVRNSVESSAKLSSREYLPILIARALPGIRLKHLSIPPQELPRRGNTHYFQVDAHGDQWAAVEQGRNLALYWDTAPEDAEAELMVVEVK